MDLENRALENAIDGLDGAAADGQNWAPVRKEDLDEHFARIYESLGISPDDEKPSPSLSNSSARYRWRYFSPGSRGEDYPEEPTFVVIEDVDDPDEYSDFQDFAYDEFNLVDVMAFTYEPEGGMEAVEDTLGLLREDPRMIEDPTVEL